MSYQIQLSNGSTLTTMADGTVDNTTSLTLVGRNYPGYGQVIADDLVHLLENAANVTPPANPLVGQLWFNTSTKLVNVWTGTTWFALTTGVASVVGFSGSVTLANLVTGGLAPLASPALTGVPTAPTASANTSTTQLATTAFVSTKIGTLVTGVSSVLGYTGAVSLSQMVTGGLAPLGSPNFNGTPTAPTPANGTNNTQIATTAFVFSQVGALTTGVSSVLGNSGAVSLPQMITGGLAPLSSPTLTGIPVAPTPATGTNTNQVATAAMVTTAVAAALGNVRGRLTTNTAFYVNSAVGSDSTGLGTQAKPWQTLQGSFDILQQFYDLAGWNVTIHCAGTFTAGLGVGAYLTGQLSPNGLVYDGGGVSTVGISSNSTCFYLNGGGYTVQNFYMYNTGSIFGGQGHCIAVNTGTLNHQGNNFGPATGAHLTTYGAGCNINCLGSYSISGSAGVGHWAAGLLGSIRTIGSINIAIAGTINFPNGFAEVSGSANLSVQGVTFSGAATGYRYEVSTYGTIFVAGAGPNYFPGSIAGGNDGTGLYQ